MGPFARTLFVPSALLLSAFATPAPAAVCNVPSASHPTIQDAVEDLACAEIVIAAGSYVESVEVDRTLDITGASSSTTVVEGRIAATGAGVELSLDSLTVDASVPTVAGCFWEAVDVSGGAAMTAADLVAVNGDGDACLIFGDGFETGNTGAWSATTP